MDVKNNKIKKVLVTGGAGYLGSEIVSSLVESGVNVVVLDKFYFGRDNLTPADNLTLVEGSPLDIGKTSIALKNVDAVIHLTGMVGDSSCGLSEFNTLHTNFTSTIRLFKLAKEVGIKKFIFASSCSVYGNNSKVDEASELYPLSLYARDKIYTEKALMALADDVQLTIMRKGTLFGWSRRPRFDLVINLLTAKVITENKITVYGNGAQWRPFIHVKDAAKAYLAVLFDENSTENEIYNIGFNDMNFTVGSIVYKLNDILNDLNIYPEISFDDTKEDDRSYKVDFTRFSSKYHIESRYNFKMGVLDLIQHIKTRGLSGWWKDKQYSNYLFYKDLYNK